MKEICPNCKYTLEFDENNYDPGTSVELECPMCGQEMTVYIPATEKTEKPQKGSQKQYSQPTPHDDVPMSPVQTPESAEPKDTSNQEQKVAEPAAPQIVYVETENNSNTKWVIAVLVVVVACIWFMVKPSQQSEPQPGLVDTDSISDIVGENADIDATEISSDEETIRQFITDMYNQSKYLDYDFLRKHCTEKLIKKLKFDYEYEGDGLAVWDFRTISQDYKSESEKNYGIVDVAYDGNGWYTYSFYDGGWKGKNRIKASIVDGIVMMDGVETIYDECKEALASAAEVEPTESEQSVSAANIEFKGYIDNKYEIVVILSQNGTKLNGRYYYVQTMLKNGDKPSTYISLTGSIDNNGNANLIGKSVDGDEENWQGKFESDTSGRTVFHGIFHGANGKEFDISMTTISN